MGENRCRRKGRKTERRQEIKSNVFSPVKTKAFRIRENRYGAGGERRAGTGGKPDKVKKMKKKEKDYKQGAREVRTTGERRPPVSPWRDPLSTPAYIGA